MKRIFACLITLMFLGSCLAYAQGPYTNSAHGDTSYGVLRQALNTAPNDYAKGNCAHCHEQHASIGGDEPAPDTLDATGPDKFCLLANNFDTAVTAGPYAQDDNACFYCHTNSDYLQDGGITNNNYSATFGGATATVTGIMQAFNQLSYHNLNDVLNFAKGASGWPSTFTADSNPCSGCHNVHIARRNKANPGDPTYTAISKPSVHDSLWGDDTPGERMTAAGYGTNYQPPYDADDTNLEPDGAGTDRATQAGETPDYNTFCLDCHENEVPSSRTSLNPNTTSGYLTAIDWITNDGTTDGEKHGKRVATGWITVDLPYTSGDDSLGYVLSCLDCHEPHGSPNVFLIRNSVNGGALGGNITTPYTTAWSYLCHRCHMDNDQTIHHSSSYDRPYNEMQCSSCHSPAFTPDTSVVMSDGTYKPIGEIKPGDKVLSFDFDKNTTCESEVVGVLSEFVSETLEINGVRTTPEQLFAVGRGRWARADKLKTGDTVLWLRKHAGGLEKIELERPIRSTHLEEVEVVDIIVKDTQKFFVIGKGKKLLVHNPSANPINCTNCHYHGSWVNDPINTLDETIDYTPTTRVTF